MDHSEPGIGPTGAARKYSLERLLEGVTEENCHPEIDLGCPVGKEAWSSELPFGDLSTLTGPEEDLFQVSRGMGSP